MILTFEQQNDLVAKGLATRKDNGKLSTFKYSRKVMYDYLWDKHPELLECRGHTYDNTNGKLVVAAPTKTFNYLENNTWKGVDTNTEVKAYKKYNGYMASAAIYKGELIVGTTGTSTSDYALYAKEQILLKGLDKKFQHEGKTYLFEIIADWDKHIVDELEGCYLLGIRDNKSGTYSPCGVSVNTTLGEMLEYTKFMKSEGWMLYSEQYGVCKLKTEYYVGKKKLMRMHPKEVHTLFNSSRSIENKLPDYWKFAVQGIKDSGTLTEWLDMTGLERREFLEKIDKERNTK
jgi:hypothetical protein